MSKRRRIRPAELRSRYWFDNPDHPDTTAICVERYMNYGHCQSNLA